MKQYQVRLPVTILMHMWQEEKQTECCLQIILTFDFPGLQGIQRKKIHGFRLRRREDNKSLVFARKRSAIRPHIPVAGQYFALWIPEEEASPTIYVDIRRLNFLVAKN